MAYHESTAGHILADKMQIVISDVKAVLKAPNNEELAARKYKDILLQEHDISKAMDEIKCLYSVSEDVTTLEGLANRLIKGAKSICDLKKLKEMDDFVLDMFKSFMDTVAEKEDDITYQIRRNSRNDKEESRDFMQCRVYLCPNYKHEDEPRFGHDAGKDIIESVIKKVIGQRTHNILLSNIEYMVGLSKEIKGMETSEEGAVPQRLYATYHSNEGDRIDLDVRKCFTKVAIGPTESFRFSNHSLDIAVHRFTEKLCYHDESRTTEVVKPSDFNKDMSRIGKYMREGGLILALVPDFMWRSKEILALRSTHKFLWSLKLPDPVFKAQYTLVALRYTQNMTEEEREENFKALMNIKPVEEITDDMIAEAIKTIPSNDKGDLHLVTGSMMDKAILEIVLSESNIHGVYKTPPKTKIKPLLPLKKGQIGQMIASGKLDGIIDEGNGHKHVIRGRVYKGHVSTVQNDYSDPDNATETTTTIENNLIEINVFSGDGVYKSIAVAS